jgi:hypothetical protein
MTIIIIIGVLFVIAALFTVAGFIVEDAMRKYFKGEE